MSEFEVQTKEYLNYCRNHKRLNPKTCKAYQIDLLQYQKFLTEPLDYMLRSNIEQYIVHLHTRYKQKSVKRKIASLKAYFHYLEYKEVIEINPFNKIDVRFREEKLLPKTIPFHSIQLFLKELYRQKAIAQTEYQLHYCIRDIAVIELLFATGIRISELCSLRKEDIDLTECTVRIYGKGAKERIIQLGNREVLDALRLYQETFDKKLATCHYFFINRLCNKLSDQSVRYMILHYAKLAGISQHLTPHMFRHTFATLLLEQDVDIRYIQRILGHSSINTTEIYTHVSNAKQKEILVHKHPRNLLKVNEG